MPLKGIPPTISPELLYALARMGHGDQLVLADANFPSDSIADRTIWKQVIRVNVGSTSELLRDILTLLPLDAYVTHPVLVMDRVDGDKERNLEVPAYSSLASAAGIGERSLGYIERFQFYEMAKKGFVVVQTNDRTLYANAIISKGVL